LREAIDIDAYRTGSARSRPACLLLRRLRLARDHYLADRDRLICAREIKQIRPRISPRPDLIGARCTSDRAAIAFQAVAVNIPPKRYCYKRNNGKPEPQRTMRPPEDFPTRSISNRISRSAEQADHSVKAPVRQYLAICSIDHFIQIRRRQSNGRRVYIRPRSHRGFISWRPLPARKLAHARRPKASASHIAASG
jgi:hypothetical protein